MVVLRPGKILGDSWTGSGEMSYLEEEIASRTRRAMFANDDCPEEILAVALWDQLLDVLRWGPR